MPFSCPHCTTASEQVALVVGFVLLQACGGESRDEETLTGLDDGAAGIAVVDDQPAGFGGAQATNQAFELTLAEVTENSFTLELAASRSVYANACLVSSVRGLEPDQQTWRDLLPQLNGIYLDGGLVYIEGCHVNCSCQGSICSEGSTFSFNRQKVELIGEVLVSDDPGQLIPPTLAEATMAESDLDTGRAIEVYETRTLTGRVEVTIRYSDDPACYAVSSSKATIDLGP